jgi:hypothetical protein
VPSVENSDAAVLKWLMNARDVIAPADDVGPELADLGRRRVPTRGRRDQLLVEIIWSLASALSRTSTAT